MGFIPPNVPELPAATPAGYVLTANGTTWVAAPAPTARTFAFFAG